MIFLLGRGGAGRSPRWSPGRYFPADGWPALAALGTAVVDRRHRDKQRSPRTQNLLQPHARQGRSSTPSHLRKSALMIPTQTVFLEVRYFLTESDLMEYNDPPEPMLVKEYHSDLRHTTNIKIRRGRTPRDSVAANNRGQPSKKGRVPGKRARGRKPWTH